MRDSGGRLGLFIECYARECLHVNGSRKERPSEASQFRPFLLMDFIELSAEPIKRPKENKLKIDEDNY